MALPAARQCVGPVRHKGQVIPSTGSRRWPPSRAGGDWPRAGPPRRASQAVPPAFEPLGALAKALEWGVCGAFSTPSHARSPDFRMDRRTHAAATVRVRWDDQSMTSHPTPAATIKDQLWGAADPTGETRQLIDAVLHAPDVPDWLARLGIDVDAEWQRMASLGAEYTQFMSDTESTRRSIGQSSIPSSSGPCRGHGRRWTGVGRSARQ